jgi:hypothetical protein
MMGLMRDAHFPLIYFCILVEIIIKGTLRKRGIGVSAILSQISTCLSRRFSMTRPMSERRDTQSKFCILAEFLWRGMQNNRWWRFGGLHGGMGRG